MADQLALIGVGEDPLIIQFANLADVVQEDTHQQKVAVEPRVERQQALGGVHERDHVLEQPAQVGVMVADAGRHLAKAAHEFLVHEETLGQGPQMRIGQLQQEAAQPLQKLVRVLLGVRQEVGELDLLGLGTLNMAQNDLKGPLEELYLALGEQEITGLEGAVEVLAGIPQPGADRAGAVAQLELEVEVAVTVGPQLLVHYQVNVVERIAVGKLLDKSPCHCPWSIFPNPWPRGAKPQLPLYNDYRFLASE